MDNNDNQGKPNKYNWWKNLNTEEWIILLIAVMSIFGFLYMADKNNNVIPPVKHKIFDPESMMEIDVYNYKTNHIKRCGLPESFVWSNENRLKYAKEIELTIKKMK